MSEGYHGRIAANYRAMSEACRALADSFDQLHLADLLPDLLRTLHNGYLLVQLLDEVPPSPGAGEALVVFREVQYAMQDGRVYGADPPQDWCADAAAKLRALAPRLRQVSDWALRTSVEPGASSATSSSPPTEQRGAKQGEGGKPLAVPAPKRSTERGEGRAKLIAALTQHHKYADGGCLNLEPIGNNALAKAAGVSPSTASAFFNDKFQGHTKYKALCRNASKLAAALKLLNDEFAPYHLLGDASSDVAATEQDDAGSE